MKNRVCPIDTDWAIVILPSMFCSSFLVVDALVPDILVWVKLWASGPFIVDFALQLMVGFGLVGCLVWQVIHFPWDHHDIYLLGLLPIGIRQFFVKKNGGLNQQRAIFARVGFLFSSALLCAVGSGRS